MDLLVVHNVRRRHQILGKGSGLVGADHSHSAKCLNDFQVGHQHIAALESLCGQGQGDGDLGKKAFRNVGDDDGDQEDDGLLPRVAVEQREDEEGDAEH